MSTEIAGSAVVDSGQLDASIIVCTYNRARSLDQTLTALREQRVPSTLRWEIIVVDNNSRDDTRTVVQAACDRRGGPGIHYAFEPTQGLSHARNLGIGIARGVVLLFTDDDVLPEPDWLATTLSSMVEHDCDACGGYIAPIWETTPPSWLTERFHGFLAIRMESAGPYQLDSRSELPFGANMAFRRSVFMDLGNFDVNRGRKGNVLAGGEESDLFRRLIQSNRRVMYFPQSRVHHKVESFRVRKQYFRRWRYQGSRNIAQTVGVPEGTPLFGVPAYLVAQTFRAGARAIWCRLTAPADEAFLQEMVVWHFFGLIAGLLSSHRKAVPR